MLNRNKAAKLFSFGNGYESQVLGLQDFKNSLERDFFANAELSCQLNKNGTTTNIVVVLNCNFSLTESLFHLNNGNWAGFLADKKQMPKFKQSILELNGKNNTRLEISELSINFSDTSLIISKTYPGSIPDKLGVILPALSENFIHFTRGLTEMPFEIFVPIFVEKTVSVGINSDMSNRIQLCTMGYFDYWGLYFESNAEKDPVIFDVKNKNITEEEFFFLDYQ